MQKIENPHWHLSRIIEESGRRDAWVNDRGVELPPNSAIKPNRVYQIVYGGLTWFGELEWFFTNPPQAPEPKYRYDMLNWILPNESHGYLTIYSNDGTNFVKGRTALEINEATTEQLQGRKRSYT